ncbi:hypothetical protein [Acidiferrobacter sp.]|uniref:hypothetical protein n=1 Tax=Acidiferrobacter sp. TaxID=1872107 RepID=UPI00260A2C9C|nr:hypothetical protein [Acidiferrobacter sp.]
MINKLRQMADNFLWGMIGALGGNGEQYCRVAAADLDTSGRRTLLLTASGEYGTVFQARGLRGLPTDGMDALIGTLTNKMPGILADGSIITMEFERDPERGPTQIAANTRYLRQAAHVHGLDLEDLLDEREQVLSERVVGEIATIGVWTPRPADPHEREAMMKALVRESRKGAPGIGIFARADDALRSRHESSVRSLRVETEACGYDLEPMLAEDALALSRRMLYPNETPDGWRPFLAGDPVRGSLVTNGGSAAAVTGLFAPSIAEQVIIGDMARVGPAVAVGGRYYRVMGLRIGPTTTEPFTRLLLRAGRLPFRMRIRIAGNGLGAVMGLKHTLAKGLSATSAVNRQLVAAAKALKNWVEVDHGTVVDLRILVATWGKTLEEADSRASQLRTMLAGWGAGSARPEPSERLARPIRALAQITPALSPDVDSWVLPAPISEALWMMPLSRPVSPWNLGSVDMRTEDGAFYPIDPASFLMTSRVSLGTAPMRMGKSLASNGRLLSIVLQPGQERIPRILIIDSGWSSLGLIRLLRDAARPEHREYFQHYRVQMDPTRFAINPMDLPLGLRFPLSVQSNFIINMLTTLCTPLGEKTPPAGVDGALQSLVERVYEDRAPHAHPRMYYPGVSPAVDAALAEIGATPDTWWQAADLLFRANRVDLARAAQAQAVPTIPDLAGLARDRHVNPTYADMKTPTGETVTDYIFRSITEVSRSLPILTSPTRFDVRGARVLALDLAEVTVPSDNPRDHRQAAIMYLLARQVGASSFYERAEDYRNLSEKQLPAIYRGYIEARARETERDLKEIVYDEFHRTGGHKGVQDQVIIDVREGPKYNVGVSLFSQRPEDFSSSLRELATTLLIFGVGGGEDAEKLKGMFGLSDGAISIIKNMRKPDRDGSHVFVRFMTQRGTYQAKLRYARGPIELWALSTTPADNAVMAMVSAAVGVTEARRRLAIAYPGGTIEGEMDKRLRATMDKGGNETSETASGQILEQIAREVVERPI